METTTNAQNSANFEKSLNWFEIPVLDLNRAVTFYNAIYDMDMEMTTSNNYEMAFFPESNSIGGALVKGPGCFPSQTGSLIYLNGGDDLQQILDKVRENGGRVILEKTEVGNGHGCFGLFVDSEGNKLALHSEQPAAPKSEKSDDSVEEKEPMAEKEKNGLLNPKSNEEYKPETSKTNKAQNRKVQVD